MERNSHPKVESLRKELESYVIAWNTCLKKIVGKMDLIILLRNAHPAYTSNFASKLLEAGMLTKHEASEFIKYVR